MSRKGHREPTEDEKEHAYVMHNKRSYGDKIQGDQAEFLSYKGEHGEVKERRQAWSATHTPGQGGEEEPAPEAARAAAERGREMAQEEKRRDAAGIEKKPAEKYDEKA